MGENSFEQQSYRNHELDYQEYANSDGGQKHVIKELFDVGTLYAWRHDRMRATISPLLKNYPGSQWVTVGDGIGSDAHFLQKAGANAVATDIADTVLKKAHEAGFIKDFRKENAEALSFRDSQFDFVLCKEAYHHFPRPMVALYEMIRVSRNGVVLIEPDDKAVVDGFRALSLLQLPINLLLNFFKRKPASRFRYYFDNYEDVGNYAYSISEREMEKVALGLNLEMIAFKGINDYYITSDEGAIKDGNAGKLKKIKARIRNNDILCALGLIHYKILVAILFKIKPSDEGVRDLRDNGFKVMLLSRNPFIQ